MPDSMSTTNNSTSLSATACSTWHRIDRSGDQASGIHEPKPAAIPLGGGEMTVARHTRLGVHDRLAPPDDAVEERGLADVGPADDGNGGDAHAATTSPTNASAKSYDSLMGIGSCEARS